MDVWEFKRGHKSIEYDLCEGQGKTATTKENIEQLHNMVLNDHQLNGA